MKKILKFIGLLLDDCFFGGYQHKYDKRTYKYTWYDSVDRWYK